MAASSAFNPHSRIRILMAICLGMMALFVIRLFYMQIIQYGHYRDEAEAEQVKSSIIPAKRGEIYAMDGTSPVKMVLNESVYTVFADPVEVEKPGELVKAIQEVAGGTAMSDLDKLVRAKPRRYMIVAKNVTRKQAEILKAKHLAGLGFQETTRRVYPEGQLASQILGFVNDEGKGQYGLEEGMDDALKGKDGKLVAVTDISNVPLTIGSKNIQVAPVDGKNVVLTVDRNIQAYTEKALAEGLQKVGATNGSAIVMDPQTGQILAMANVPTYNPEQYTKVTDGQAFNNATISVPYEPGSVMKTFTTATGLDKGVITPDSTYVNTDYIKVGDTTIQNATKGQTGTITIQHALNYSLNTGFVTVAERLGDGSHINLAARNTMYSYLHDKFGLGQRTGLELAGESSGKVIPPTDPEGGEVRYSNMAFGQGMNLTMVQVAAGFSSIINGGRYYKPAIIAGAVNSDGVFKANPIPQPARQTISPQVSATAKQMIHDARASSSFNRNDKKGYDVGGKTGTSQTLINGSYDNNQTIGSYLGYGGDTKPRYVIMIQVSGKNRNFAGNADAMPIFTNISNWMIEYKQLIPQS